MLWVRGCRLGALTAGPACQDVRGHAILVTVSRSRLQSLDVMRAAAILLVIGHHARVPQSGALVDLPLTLWHRCGWMGVDLFFVLSGFLVSSLLFNSYRRTGSLGIRSFWIRRGLKIYPAFYALLLLYAPVIPAYFPNDWPKRVLAELLYVQDYVPSVFDFSWSLAVEEHFYFLLPLVLAALIRRRPEAPFAKIPVLATAVAGLCLGLRIVTALAFPYAKSVHLWPTHLRIDSLLTGVAIAYGWSFHRERMVAVGRRYRIPLLALTAVGVAGPLCWPLGTSRLLVSVGFTLLQLGFAALLLTVLAREATTPARAGVGRVVAAAAAVVGRDSYSIYLWHMTALYRVGSLLPTMSWHLQFALGLVLSAALGVGMARLIERPVLRVRDRLFPPATPEPAVQATL